MLIYLLNLNLVLKKIKMTDFVDPQVESINQPEVLFN